MNPYGFEFRHGRVWVMSDGKSGSGGDSGTATPIKKKRRHTATPRSGRSALASDGSEPTTPTPVLTRETSVHDDTGDSPANTADAPAKKLKIRIFYTNNDGTRTERPKTVVEKELGEEIITQVGVVKDESDISEEG